MGIGLSLLFLNKSSLGGFGLIAVYLQQRFSWDPGRTNLLFDTLIICSGAFAASLMDTFFSALSVVIISIIISLSKNRIANNYVLTTTP